MDKSKTKQQLLLDIEELRTRLEEAEETLRAIRSGEVDALVVSGIQGDQIYTLQGADRSYRILFENMEEGAATLNNDGTILYCNRRLAAMLEEPLEKVIGSSIGKYFSSADWQALQPMFKKGNSATNRGEFNLKTADGNQLPVLVSLGGLELGDGQVICLTAADLTEQKRVEKELRKAHDELEIRLQERTEELVRANETLQAEIAEREKADVGLKEGREHLRLAQRAANARAWSWDIVTGELKWAEEFYAAYGLEDSIKPYYDDWLRTIHPEDRERVDKTLGDAINNKGEIDVEYRTILPDGRICWLNAKGQTFYDETHRPVRMVGITLDITERKLAEEALGRSQQLFADIFRVSPAATILSSVADGRCVDANEAYARLTGYTREELIGKTTVELKIWLSAKERQRVVTELAQKGHLENVELTLRRKDGEFINTLSSGEVITLDGQRFILSFFFDITKRKQAEEALRTALQRFYTVLSSMYASILLVGDEGRIEFANQAFCDFFDLKDSPADLTGLTTPEMIEKIKNAYLHPGQELARIREIVGRGQPVKGEEISMRGERTCLRDFIPIYVDGKSYGRLWHHLEITERKRAEEALKESEEKFRNLVKYAPAAIYEMDLEGTKFLSVNDAMCDVIKYSREELLSMKPVDLLDQESRSLFEERISKILAGEEIDETVEYRIRRKDGEWIYATINVGALTYTKDKPSRVVVIAYDVTERRRIEEALRQSEERYRQLVQHAPAGIYEVDFTTGHFTEVNDVMGQILGYTRDELLTMTPFDILDDEGRARFAARIRLARSGERPDEAAEYLVRTKDGRLIWALLNVTFRWNGDRIVGATVVAHDITERKRMEEEVRRSRDELEIKVQERTAELARANEELQEEMARSERAEQQLRQAQKLEAVGTLTGGIAHDFNNILGAIVINSELALFDLPGGSGLRTNLELILKSGLRGKDLVKQMLLFSRKSEKKQEVLTLTPLIKETFKLLRSSLPTTIQMELLLKTESDAVYGDPSQIQQVIMNLCTNAAYAMRGTTGSIDISLQGITFSSTDLPEADMQPGDYLVLSVKDTGSGMDEEVKKRIFEPFFTTKPVGEGTGLGLSVVYGIVKSHKGGITVYSEPGKGSVFKVYLPRVDTDVSVEAETPEPIPRGNERILLLDDEEMIVNSVRNMLQHLGYKVTALMDSQEALKLFSEKPSEFDLVITDQTMPFMTGEDLGKELMRIRPDIPVILCTGYSDLISSEKAMAMGFRGFIMKPFNVREGAELVRSVLDQKGPN